MGQKGLKEKKRGWEATCPFALYSHTQIPYGKEEQSKKTGKPGAVPATGAPVVDQKKKKKTIGGRLQVVGNGGNRRETERGWGGEKSREGFQFAGGEAADPIKPLGEKPPMGLVGLLNLLQRWGNCRRFAVEKKGLRVHCPRSEMDSDGDQTPAPALSVRHEREVPFC